MTENNKRTYEVEIGGLGSLRLTQEDAQDSPHKTARRKNSYENLPAPEKKRVVVRIIDTVKDL